MVINKGGKMFQQKKEKRIVFEWMRDLFMSYYDASTKTCSGNTFKVVVNYYSKRRSIIVIESTFYKKTYTGVGLARLGIGAEPNKMVIEQIVIGRAIKDIVRQMFLDGWGKYLFNGMKAIPVKETDNGKLPTLSGNVAEVSSKVQHTTAMVT
jgi:hypothetical protein